MSNHEGILATYGAMFDGGSDSSRAEIASDWAETFTADEMAEWLDAGCWDAASARELDLAGFRPGRDELAYRHGEERQGMDAMYAFCNSDIRIEKLTW